MDMEQKSQRTRIQAKEMNELKGVCGVNRIDNECNESVYGRFGVFSKE